MQFLPCSRLRQNSSRFLACGNWPAMPITAMGCDAGDGGALEPNRDARLWRREESFAVAILIAGFCCDGRGFTGVTAAAAAGATACDNVPCFSASSFT